MNEPKEVHGSSLTIIVEIGLATTIIGIVFFMSGRYDILEILFELSRTHEEWELDELIVTSIAAVFVLLIFYTRRLILDRKMNATLIQQQEEIITANEKIKQLEGIIPICSCCKKIRSDQGYWQSVEEYIEHHSKAQFSHSMCPDCMVKLYGDEPWFKKIKTRLRMNFKNIGEH